MVSFVNKNIAIAGLVVALPKQSQELITNQGKTFDTYGIVSKRVSKLEQTTSDLGFVAAKKILAAQDVALEEIGVVLFASNTPDYRSPATACVLQGRLGLSIDCIAYDINLGSTGFATGLQNTASVLEHINKRYALLVCGDTHSKICNEKIPHTSIYGDGAAAILLEKKDDTNAIKTTYFTYSESFESFRLPFGGFRFAEEALGSHHLEINESDLNQFSSITFIEAVQAYLKDANEKKFDYVALQHKGFFPLDFILKGKTSQDFPVSEMIKNHGYLAAASIPLELTDLKGKIDKEFFNILACSFGEGLSIGLTEINLGKDTFMEVIETDEIFEDSKVGRDW